MSSKLISAPEKFYITTPIYYGNDEFHLGHSYTTICADIFARYYRMLGTKVFFLTGMDEHGLKVQQAAEKKGLAPQEFLDNLAAKTKDLWKKLDISYDYFIRTTDKKHVEFVQNIAQKMFDNGDIYLDKYEGWYCKGCESYFTEKDIVEGKCPYGHEVHFESEPAYFFKLTKYKDWLLKYYEDHLEFVQPNSRKNEMIAILNEIKDLCISRKSVSWGIPLPFDKEHTIYVWLDALFNYLSALDYPEGKNYNDFWPPDFQLMGKEIFKFHSIFWPIFLKSIDLEIPKVVFAHGWWTVEGQKMSKSLGNVIYPGPFIDNYNLDIYRYYLIREVSFGDDGTYQKKTLHDRINNELVASVGNLFSRVITLANKKENTNYKYYRDSLADAVEEKIKIIHEEYNSRNLTKALVEIMNISALANKYVQDNKPWELLKENPNKFDNVIYSLLETLRILAVEFSPIMTKKSVDMFEQLGLDFNNYEHKLLEYTNIMENKTVQKKDYLFTRVEEIK